MRITFGLHVGTWHGPTSKSHIGEPVLGRPGFLGLLETHLGLTAPGAPAAQRAAAYLVALRASDSPSRFFTASLQADEIGTAARLLRWRDDWMLVGWDGQGRADWPPRLADLAAVEAYAGGRVPPGEGERLARVAERLKCRRTPIETVLLLDPPQAYPARWQDVLALIPTQEPAPQTASGQGDLGRIQRACLQAVQQRELPQADGLRGDGTFMVLRPLSCETAEHWLASRCREIPSSSRLIVAEEHGPSVDDTLRVRGLPACGFDEPSTLRPALQALPLALETLWDPIEPGRILDFLMHPFGPFSGRVRRMLGAAFAAQPGIGGQEWSRAREQIQTEIGLEAVEQIASWLEGARSSRHAGAPLEVAMSRVGQLEQALQARLGVPGASPTLARDMQAAVSQCAAVARALQELRAQGITLVRPRLLEQLTAQATADCGNSLAVAQVNCMRSAGSPAACAVEAAEEVIWWMPAKPTLPLPHPWVTSELQALAAAGVRLRDPAAEMAALMGQWVRPVLAARTRLILVLPPEGAEEHPAYQLLKVLAPDLSVTRLEEHAESTGSVQTVGVQPLALARGVWTLDTQALWRPAYPAPTRKNSQSFSSLEVLFHNPAIAVLRDAAALRSGAVVAVEQDSRFLGTVAHRLVEKLFAHADALHWSESQLDAWYQPALQDLLRREGMLLLAPGNSMQLQQFSETLRRGVGVLLEHLRHAGAVSVQAERALTGELTTPSGPVALNGKTDLLVHVQGGATAALDLKWARAKRYREVLAGGEFLQLALYAHMIAQELGSPPAAVGYFTLLDATLLTLTDGFFGPSARVVSAKGSINCPQLVQKAAASLAWRVQQWQGGYVEVIGEGLDPAPTPPPPDCLPASRLGPWFSDYEALFGERAAT